MTSKNLFKGTRWLIEDSLMAVISVLGMCNGNQRHTDIVMQQPMQLGCLQTEKVRKVNTLFKIS